MMKKKSKCEKCGAVEIGYTTLRQTPAGATICEGGIDCNARQAGKWQDNKGNWHEE